MLNNHNSASIHHKRFKILVKEMFKIDRDLPPRIFLKNIYAQSNLAESLRNYTFERLRVHSIYQGTESLSF